MNPQTESNLSVDTATYLAHVVAAAREGGWTPAAAAGPQPTWRSALERLEQNASVTAADMRRAHEILGWVASLRPRDPDGYRARLVTCLARQELTVRELPLAASAVRAFNLHLYYEIRGRRSAARREVAA